MKKITAIILCIVLLISLTACSGGKDTSSGNASANNNQTQSNNQSEDTTSSDIEKSTEETAREEILENGNWYSYMKENRLTLDF